MEINKIEEGKYKVSVDGHTSIMTLDEVMAILSKPVNTKTPNEADLTHLVYKTEKYKE